MGDGEDRVRRLAKERNAFREADEQAEADRMGISVPEYRRGADVGVWRSGEDAGPRWPYNERLPVFRDEPATPPFQNDQRLRLAKPHPGVRKNSDRPGYRNDT